MISQMTKVRPIGHRQRPLLLGLAEIELSFCAYNLFEHVQDPTTDLLPALESDVRNGNLESPPAPQAKHILTGLCFYLNGSTAPLVSDHKLKHMLSAHGANHSIALGRRTVTHVILGTVNANGGCGGGLAAAKIQKEVARTGGKAVKYITVEWYVLLVTKSMPLGHDWYGYV
jgi:hypothetical protein